MATVESGSRRRDRRRAGRAGGGVHAGGPRATRVVAVREEPVARRQGGRPERGRLPLRHGADHPHHPVGPAPHLRRGRPRARRLPRPRPPRPAVAVLLRRRHASSTSSKTSTRWRSARRASPRAPARRRATATSSPSPNRLHRISDRYFFWKSIGGIARHDRPEGRVLADDPRRRAEHADGPVGRRARCGSSSRTPRVAQMLDHFTQYVGSCPDASPAVLCGIAHMQTSEGIWYPRGGTRAVPEALVKLGRRTRRRAAAPNAASRRIADRRRRDRGARRRDRRRRGGRLAAVVSNADSVRTHRELLDGTAPRAAQRFEKRRGYEPACSGVVLYLGLNRAYDHLLHHDFVFSRDPHEEFDFIYHKGEPAPDPTCYLASTGPHRTGHRPARRRGAVRARPHAVPAAAPRLEADAARVPPGDPRQAEDDGADAGPRRPHRVRVGPDAAGHPRPLPRAQRGDLRAGEPRASGSGRSSRRTARRT